MSPVVPKFVVTLGLILGSTLAGYLARKSGRVPEPLARRLMTFVVVLGYTPVSFLSIWSLRLHAADLWLPVLATAHVVLMTLLCLPIGPLLARDRQELGLFRATAGFGNNGFTMGGFVIFLLYGVEGLGRVSIFGLAWTPTCVLIMYPIARHYSGQTAGMGLGRLMLRNVLDWRSIGLPVSIVAIFISLSDVPRPAFVARYRVMDCLVYSVTALVYFSIGLRLRGSYIAPLKKMIVGLAAARFALGPVVGLGLVYLTTLTAWPLVGVGRNVILIQSFVPVAVTTVAVANMFNLRPRESSVLFVTNTVLYLVAVLPLVLWIFG